jgi:hypothetical protein
MPNCLVRVFDHDKDGDESESGYFVSEPNELEVILTAYDAHAMSRYLHEGTDEVPNIELEEAEDSSNGNWISNFFGK